MVPASLGFPCVFYKQSSSYGQNLRNYLIQAGYTQGYSWNYNEQSDNHSKDSGKVTDLQLGIIISLTCVALILLSVAIYWKHRTSLDAQSSQVGEEYHSLYPSGSDHSNDHEGGSDSHGMSLKGAGLSHETMILVESLNN